MSTKKLTVKQQELAEKYATEIAKYVTLVKQAEAAQDEAIAAGADGYDIALAYGEPMHQATDVLNDIELSVTNDCYAIPYKASRDKTIDAFMAYVKSLAE